jgi:hypothetical protein
MAARDPAGRGSVNPAAAERWRAAPGLMEPRGRRVRSRAAASGSPCGRPTHAYPNARTTPAVRAEIAASQEPTGVLAQRYGISTETVRKWRKRGPDDCLDHSTRPKTLPWKATADERAIVGAVREATRFPLDDLTFAIRHFLPHLNRYSIYRILKAEGLHRLADLPPLYPDERPRKGRGRFKAYDLGFVHIDIKHLPKLRTRDGECRKRYLYRPALAARASGGHGR